MAITVKKLVKYAQKSYKMKLLAGESGMNRLVQWAHIVEDPDVCFFLRGQEIIFTVGIMNRDEGWLLKFARNLYTTGVSAFVVNLGPHTKTVPEEVISFCDQVSMPLFTVPWEIRLVDMTRDFCYKIMTEANIEDSIVTTIQNLIFKVGDPETQILQMERYGYRKDSRFLFICISLDEEPGTKPYESHMQDLKRNAEWIARGIRDLYISFEYQNKLILTLVEYTDDEVRQFTDEFIRIITHRQMETRVHMGLSSNISGVTSQDQNFQNAFMTSELAQKRHELLLQYDNLDVHKFIMSVPDRRILQEYYDRTLGKLDAYDEENGTNLTEFLRIYLENNASPQLVSEKQYIHRNTVNNMLRKIEKIVGLSLNDLEGKVKYFIAYYISDIL